MRFIMRRGEKNKGESGEDKEKQKESVQNRNPKENQIQKFKQWSKVCQIILKSSQIKNIPEKAESDKVK